MDRNSPLSCGNPPAGCLHRASVHCSCSTSLQQTFFTTKIGPRRLPRLIVHRVALFVPPGSWLLEPCAAHHKTVHSDCSRQLYLGILRQLSSGSSPRMCSFTESSCLLRVTECEWPKPTNLPLECSNINNSIDANVHLAIRYVAHSFLAFSLQEYLPIPLIAACGGSSFV